ncbi:MAG: hypothetical protein ACYTDU_19995, partial [Planctomycetota bacterium]
MTKKQEDALAAKRSEVVRTAVEIGEVTTPAKYEAAGHLLVVTKDLAKQIRDYFKPLKAAAHETHKALTAREKEELGPVLEAQAVLTRGLDAYDEKIRREAEEQEALARQAAEEAAIERAERLEEAGMHEEAELALERGGQVVAPVPEAPKVNGLSTSRRWDFEILDQARLAPAYLVPDTVKIRRVVQAHGRDAPAVLGEGSVRVF